MAGKTTPAGGGRNTLSLPSSSGRKSTAKIQEPTINWIVRTGNERSFVGAKKESKSSDLFWLSHPADGLRFFQLLKHFLLLARIVAPQEAIHKWGVDSGRRNAIAANIVGQIILCYGIGHSNDRALAHGIGETVREAGSSCNGSHVQDDAASVRFHVAHRGVHAVVHALNIYAENFV